MMVWCETREDKTGGLEGIVWNLALAEIGGAEEQRRRRAEEERKR